MTQTLWAGLHVTSGTGGTLTVRVQTDDAVGFAMLGRVADGFRRLEAGLQRATELSNGAQWGTDLLRRYRAAMDRFTERYGEKLLESGEGVNG